MSYNVSGQYNIKTRKWFLGKSCSKENAKRKNQQSVCLCVAQGWGSRWECADGAEAVKTE